MVGLANPISNDVLLLQYNTKWQKERRWDSYWSLVLSTTDHENGEVEEVL